ncbi:MAG: hypothetical protein EXQ98_06650 [Alphaproteobacteria bacterium]|nr:hypothetical protein [Alphaproteobacteria bacterium]
MKFHIDIECSPQEARAFFGLPDVEPMQKAVMADIEQRMRTAIAGIEPEALMRNWGPSMMKGFEELQKTFWGGMGGLGMKDNKKD